MKKILPFFLLLLLPLSVSATTLPTNQGGTGTTSPSGILYGDNNLTGHLNTLTIGTNLTLVGSTLNASGGSGGSGSVSTSSVPVIGNLSYWTTNTATPALLGTVATTSQSFSGPFSIAGTIGALVGGANSTITWTGLATTSQPSSSNLLVSNGAAGVFGVATSTLTGTGGISVSNAPFIIGGSGAVVSCATCTLNGVTSVTGTWPIISSGGATPAISWGGLSTTTNLTTGQLVYASGVGSITSVATSTLTPSSPLTGSFIQIGSAGSVGIQAASGSQNGYLAAADYSLLHTATSTFTAPLAWTASTNAVTCATAAAGTAGCLSASGGSLLYTATSTFTSPLVYTNSTNAVTCPTCLVSSTNLWPFTADTFNGVANQSTTTPLWLKNTMVIASTTYFTLASTTQLTVSSTSWLGTALGTTFDTAGAGNLFKINGQQLTAVSGTGGTAALSANPTFTGTATFATASTSANLFLSQLGTAAGTFLAVNPAGQVIATSTPATGTGTVTSVATNNGITGGTITTTGTLSLDESFGGVNTAASSTWTGHTAFNTASSTQFSSPTIWNSTVGNAVWLGDANGKATAATTQTCTNQFVRAMSAAYSATCATVGAADVSLANLSATDSTLTFSGTYTGATARTIGINLGNANTWTSLQTINNASTTNFSVSSGMVSAYNSIPFYMASTTWGAGTTTITVLNNPHNVTFSDAQCNTDAGTLMVRLYHGTVNNLNLMLASTTINTNVFSSNNVLSVSTTTFMDIGSAASSPTKINCTIEYIYNQS